MQYVHTPACPSVRIKKNAVNISYSIPLCKAFLHRHDMEIVATTIRVHEYTVRRALASPKHCSAENKHRAAFCLYGKLFKLQKTMHRKFNIFLAFLSAQPCKTMYLYRWALQLGHPFYSRGHFSTFRFRCERCTVHYISVTLSFQG